MSYKVRLDIFEGPLDLLLHLVKKNEVDSISDCFLVSEDRTDSLIKIALMPKSTKIVRNATKVVA